MTDYKNGKIYKLWSPHNDLIYIGSTCQPLHKRLYGHKSRYNTGNLHANSRLLFETGHEVKIELIEEYACNNRMELTKKEGEHIRENQCVNKRIEGRTSQEYGKEYYENHKEAIKEYKKEHNKEYHENNKEAIKEHKSQPYECVCGSTVRFGEKSKHFKTKKHMNFIQEE